jgi:hypothetical protein
MQEIARQESNEYIYYGLANGQNNGGQEVYHSRRRPKVHYIQLHVLHLVLENIRFYKRFVAAKVIEPSVRVGIK